MRNPRAVLVLALALALDSRAAEAPAPAPTRAPAPRPSRSLPAGVTATVAPEPPLSPEEALRSFKVASGFRIELVAAEPLVDTPVAVAFDADGRLWVVEMPGFMPNVAGTGEENPVGRVVVIDDTDGDGRMDKRTVFLDGLVLPRSIALVAGGVLVGAPPDLIYCHDADRDDRCDKPEVVAGGYGTRGNPEHNANGLVPALDNWLYNANLGARYRFSGGSWRTEPTMSRGQWGIAQDDVGRLFYNTNSVYLRGDFLPVYVPDAHLRGTRGVNVEIDPDQTTWPGRPNTGVNRAYREGTLRPDGTLAEFTAACAPHVYRGDQFPETFRGNVFVAEPAANLVRGSVVAEYAGALLAQNAFPQGEFLTSTDERFRPVSLATGPDGALYVADIYRGLIQHRIYLTEFLRGQIRERGLDRPVDRGRIWRVVHGGQPLGPRPKLRGATAEALVAHLAHPNGWWRDTAQRLLVERGDRAIVPALGTLVRTAPDPRTRLHALFVLEGLDAIDDDTLAATARDGNRFVRLASAGLLELSAIAALVGVAGELAAAPRLDEKTLDRVAGRELHLLGRIVVHPEWKPHSPERADVLRRLAVRVIGDGREERIEGLLELVAAEPSGAEWRQLALLKGVAEAKRGERDQRLGPPQGWARLLRSRDEDVRRQAEALDAWVTGQVRTRAQMSGGGLSAGARERFARGKTHYAGICGACHHPSGIGETGKAPPLVGSPWVTGPVERLVRITLQGMRGPVRVGDRVYRMEMPAMGALTDDELADLLTYIRNEADWGHDAGSVGPEAVARIRRATEVRKEPWTAAELLALR